MERSDKKWKFSMDDIEEREHWDKYMKVYEDVFNNTSTDLAPWYIIPDNNRWFARSIVASIVLTKLKSLHSKYPVLNDEQEKNIAKAKKILQQKDFKNK
jgi:polyphosphate kinase 2 (PPK2 family)